MRNYLQHGDRHRPTGTDPIPGLAASGLSWAYQAAKASATTVGTASSVVIAPTTATGFFTNDTSLFTQGSVVVGGTTYHGIRYVGASGLYLTWSTMYPSSAITAGVDYAIDILSFNDPDEALPLIGPATRRIALASDSTDSQAVSWISLGTLDSGAMSHATVWGGVNANSVASFTAYLVTLTVCLDPNQSAYVG